MDKRRVIIFGIWKELRENDTDFSERESIKPCFLIIIITVRGRLEGLKKLSHTPLEKAILLL